MTTPLAAPGKGRRDYPQPPEGGQRLVCIDVVRRGEMETKYGPKRRLDIFFASEHRSSDGQLLTCFRRFNESLHEKSLLRQFLFQWRGRDIDPDEFVDGMFDLDRVIGRTGYATITHAQVGNKTYANIASLVPLPGGMEELPLPDDYTRVRDRDKAKAVRETFADDVDDDDLPF